MVVYAVWDRVAWVRFPASRQLNCYNARMNLRVAAKGLIKNSEGKILIMHEDAQEYIDCTEDNKWDVVGGRIETSETLHDGLKREILEESGLSIVVGEVIEVTETFPNIHDEDQHIVRVYYSCITQDRIVTLSKDHDEYKWIDPTLHRQHNLMDDLHDVFEKYLKQS